MCNKYINRYNILRVYNSVVRNYYHAWSFIDFDVNPFKTHMEVT